MTPSVGSWSDPVWSIPSLDSGISAVLTLECTMDTEDTQTNAAEITASATYDPDTDNHSASVEITTPPPVPSTRRWGMVIMLAALGGLLLRRFNR